MIQVYINKEIEGWIDTLTELFCLQDNRPIVTLSLKRNNKCGRCLFATPKINSKIVIGCKDGKIRLSTLVHEFIHAMGYAHITNINGWANFHHYHESENRELDHMKKGQYDNFSRLIVKDLTGRYELLI